MRTPPSFTDTPLTKSDQDFIDGIRHIINKFVKSKERVLELSPMNSFQRRLIHKLATAYNMKSQSVGNTDERYVCLIKTEKTTMPPKRNQSFSGSQVFDNGDRIYFTTPKTKILLRSDGSFGISLKDERFPIIDERVVEDGEFRIRKNKIVCPNDDLW